jgi:hypothetical protein
MDYELLYQCTDSVTESNVRVHFLITPTHEPLSFFILGSEGRLLQRITAGDPPSMSPVRECLDALVYMHDTLQCVELDVVNGGVIAYLHALSKDNTPRPPIPLEQPFALCVALQAHAPLHMTEALYLHISNTLQLQQQCEGETFAVAGPGKDTPSLH